MQKAKNLWQGGRKMAEMVLAGQLGIERETKVNRPTLK
jgi:hypothetical protein